MIGPTSPLPAIRRQPPRQSRTVTQVLGQIDAKGYGRFASRFHDSIHAIGQIDTQNITAETSTLSSPLFVPKGSFVGDSITPMGLEYTVSANSPVAHL